MGVRTRGLDIKAGAMRNAACRHRACAQVARAKAHIRPRKTSTSQKEIATLSPAFFFNSLAENGSCRRKAGLCEICRLDKVRFRRSQDFCCPALFRLRERPRYSFVRQALPSKVPEASNAHSPYRRTHTLWILRQAAANRER
jgi:hypothetical protein